MLNHIIMDIRTDTWYLYRNPPCMSLFPPHREKSSYGPASHRGVPLELTAVITLLAHITRNFTSTSKKTNDWINSVFIFAKENNTAVMTDAAVTTTTLPRRSRKTTTATTTATTTTDRTHVMTSSILDEDDEDVQNANTPDELTSSSSVIRLPQLQQHHHHHHHHHDADRRTLIGRFLCSV